LSLRHKFLAFYVRKHLVTTREAGGRRQEAGGRRQEAGGRRQETGDRRQETERQRDRETESQKVRSQNDLPFDSERAGGAALYKKVKNICPTRINRKSA
jgi:hypothetical protein